MRHPWFLAALALVAGFIVFIFSLVAIPRNGEKASNDAAARTLSPLERPMVSFGDPAKGPKDAKVTIIEFGDFSCAPCATLAASVTQVLAAHPKDVRLVWKDLPNPALHPLSLDAALAARCADEQGAFWPYHDFLFAEQANLTKEALPDMAAALGLDRTKFEECQTTTRTLPVVERSAEEAIRLGIDATPFIFIGDRRISGAVSAEALEAMIAEELSK